MVRIWFNHWFSTIYQLIDEMKRAHEDYYIIGSNENTHAVYQVLCDEWYQEPSLHEKEYVTFCLDFCRQHDIQVFVPRRHMLALSKNKAEFEKIGVKLLADDYELIEKLNYKTEAYEWLKSVSRLHIPAYERVTTIQEFMAAYEKLKADYRQVCFKFEHDEGGKSFRLIDNNRKGYTALFKKQNTRMTLDDAAAALSETERFSPLIVMPYLSGVEVSVDCLSTASGLIMIPRIKDTSRAERIVYQEDILQMCRDFWQACPLKCPFNIQFKYLDGVPYFLEVNTRMSGGVQLACAAEHINILDIAVGQLLGVEQPWQISRTEKVISYVEKPLVLSES